MKNVSPPEIGVSNQLVGLLNASMQPTLVLAIFGPVPPGTSPLNGFVILAIALLGLLYIPVQIRRMNFSKEWPKLALEVVVLLFLVFVGIAMISKNQGR